MNAQLVAEVRHDRPTVRHSIVVANVEFGAEYVADSVGQACAIDITLRKMVGEGHIGVQGRLSFIIGYCNPNYTSEKSGHYSRSVEVEFNRHFGEI
jgi:hypothetical protein